MASPTVWSGGLNLAGTVFENGPSTLQLAPTYLSGAVQFLDTIGGNNANSGVEPQLAVKTLAQAITNSAANGVIVIGEGSAETLAGSQAVSLAGLSIIGCGSGTSRPRYTCSGDVVFLNVSGAGVYIENLYFPASTSPTACTARIDLTSASCQVIGCYFECGTKDTGRALRIPVGGTNARVESCTFLSTAATPAIGLEVSGAATDCWFKSTTFDGGSFGWTDFAFKISAAALRNTIMGVSMIRRSSFGATVAGTSYKAFGLTADGINRVVLT